MGFCYEGRKLVCDLCGTAGARKVKCPAGYCQAIAQCPTCRKDPVQLAKVKEAHKDCAGASARFNAREAENARRLNEGARLRSSAMNTEDGRVHVLFKDKAGACVGFYMSPATYDAEPFLTPWTPEEFMAVGELTPAPGEFSFGRTTKQVGSITELLA